jgi:hypothetical protein
MSVKPQDVPVYQDRELDFTGDVPQQQLPDVDFKQLFGIKDENIADYPALNPSASEENQVHKTASAVDHGRRYIEITASRLADAGEEFYNLVKQAHLTDGYGILQISKVAGAMVEDPHFAQSVMQSITARLEAEGVRFNTKDELEKVAHPLVINTKHPLAQAVANLEAAAIAHYQSQEDIQKLASAHQGAVQALRKKARR